MAPRRRRKKKQDPVGAQGLVEAAKRTDANPQLVATAKFIRGLLPGGDPNSADLPPQVQRLVTELDPKGPSTMRELGMGALQAWQALSEAQRRGRGKSDVAILFTDLVGFSDWALEAGDEAALELLRRVGDAEQRAVSDNHGAVVKRLGDGSMAAFNRPEQAVAAALEAEGAAAEVEVGGYTPSLRAGVHQGRPRKVKGDFLGVDVNIAARVGDAAEGGEVLISETVREALDPKAFRFGPKLELSAAGAPADLTVCAVKAKRKRQ
ncbi:MAG: adenylate/guanylate cyclase domain-containing protein [Solirubrobacterales bacterium]